MSLILEKEPWLKSYFNQREKMDINEKEKKAKVKTEPEGDKATDQCKSTRNKVIWQTWQTAVCICEEEPTRILTILFNLSTAAEEVHFGENKGGRKPNGCTAAQQRWWAQETQQNLKHTSTGSFLPLEVKAVKSSNRDNPTAANSNSSDPDRGFNLY